MSLPEDIVNRALDKAGAEQVIGNLNEGSKEAKIALRHYGVVLRQLTRAARWQFCRKQAPLNLLADATGQTTGVGTTVPQGWLYEYAYPDDCMQIRFIPQSVYPLSLVGPPGNISLPSTPQTSVGSVVPPLVSPMVPTRFLVATDPNYPVPASQVAVPPVGNTPWWEMQGVSPTNRTVILSNVKNAQAVYSCLQIYPTLWDSLFDQAFVACLAAEFALPLAKDKKFGMQMQAQNIAIAKAAIIQARLADGNEGVTTTDHTPDWLRARNQGGGFGWSGWGPWNGVGVGFGGDGVYGYGWGTYAFPNGSAF